jgi:hypothetical protein
VEVNCWQELLYRLRGTKYQLGLMAPLSPVLHIDLEAGLTNAEVIAAENRFGFKFPPDLREFLQTALPKAVL